MSANRPNDLLLRSPLLEEAERWIARRPANAPAPTEDTQESSLSSLDRGESSCVSLKAAPLLTPLALSQ